MARSVREPLSMARLRMAAALGAAGRRMWRRKDISDSDKIVLDLVVEALHRLSADLQPAGNMTAPDLVLKKAIPDIQLQVQKLVRLAARGHHEGVLPAAGEPADAPDIPPPPVEEDGVEDHGVRDDLRMQGGVLVRRPPGLRQRLRERRAWQLHRATVAQWRISAARVQLLRRVQLRWDGMGTRLCLRSRNLAREAMREQLIAYLPRNDDGLPEVRGVPLVD